METSHQIISTNKPTPSLYSPDALHVAPSEDSHQGASSLGLVVTCTQQASVTTPVGIYMSYWWRHQGHLAIIAPVCQLAILIGIITLR